MIEFMVISGALMVGGISGYWLAAVLHRDVPTRPDALTAPPLEIVAVYEAKREMKEMEDDLVMVDYFPMSRKALKWEQEQNKREKRRR